MNDFVLVRAAVMAKDGHIEYVYETADIQYYAEVLGYELVGWEDQYI